MAWPEVVEEFAGYVARGLGATALIVAGGGDTRPAAAGGSRWIVLSDEEAGTVAEVGGGRDRLRRAIARATPGVDPIETLRAPLLLLIDATRDARTLEGSVRVAEAALADAPVAILAVGGVPPPGRVVDLLGSRGLPPTFVGEAPRFDDRDSAATIAVVEREGPPLLSAPPDFRVVAFIRTYNEADVIHHAIGDLVEQGIEVYLLDGWSSDGTIERAEPWLGRGLLAIERFPPEGATRYHPEKAVFRRIERLAAEIESDWFIHHDADERRMSPWLGLSLRDGLYHVDRRGFNSVDHTIIEFPPTSDAYDPEREFADQFRLFRFPIDASDFLQRKAWKKPGGRVSIAETAGHDIAFDGRRIYPFKFLLRHYPIRSQAHGEEKIFRVRQTRLSPIERSRGWGTHYGRFAAGARFLADPRLLAPFEEADFAERYLIERLSGIGIYERMIRAAGGPSPEWQITPTRLAWTDGSIIVEPIAAPWPDPIAPTLGRAAIRWDAAGEPEPSVWVSDGTGPEQPFAGGARGHAIADWIRPDWPYRFRLYAGRQRGALVAEVEVICRT